MQWAQRSRECPLCFKPLQLEVRIQTSLALPCLQPAGSLSIVLACPALPLSCWSGLPLMLQDKTLNELLPFGEYIPPERLATTAPCVLMGMDAWELERLLQRLAVPGGARRERRSRARAVTAEPSRSTAGTAQLCTQLLLAAYLKQGLCERARESHCMRPWGQHSCSQSQLAGSQRFAVQSLAQPQLRTHPQASFQQPSVLLKHDASHL